MMGDSGAHIYSSNGKKHQAVVSDLRGHAGYPNIHDLTEIGAHSSRWLQLIIQRQNDHPQFALPKSGALGARPRFGSDFVVILCDAHNGLHIHRLGYTGLAYVAPLGKSVYVE